MLFTWIILFVISIVVFLVVLRPWIFSSSKGIVIGISLLFAGLALLLYYHWGAIIPLHQATLLKNEMQETKEKLITLDSRAKLIAELEQRVAQHPDKAMGWYLLSKLYAGSGDEKKALHAIESARKRESDNPLFKLAIVEMHFSFHQKLTSADRSLLNSVLQSDAGNITALHLFALDAMQQKHFQLAIQYWERVLTQVPADSEDAETIRGFIKKAQVKVQ